MKHVLIVITLLSVAGLARADSPSSNDTGRCIRSNSFCQSVIADPSRPGWQTHLYLEISCEQHKDPTSCVGVARSKGLLGHEEVAMGYIKMACALDAKYCEMVKILKCSKEGKKTYAECTNGSQFFDTPTEHEARQTK